jgi:hypothetical protein
MTTVDDIAALLRDDGAECVVQYGSSLTAPDRANDIDLVALYPTDADTHFQLGKYDVTRLSIDEFEYYQQTLNPVYCTEPCLTGEVVAGDPDIVAETVDRLRGEAPPQRAVNHNVNRSVQAFEDCVDALGENAARYTVRRLPFVASYWLFASWYLAGNPPAELKSVRQQVGNTAVLDEIFDLTRMERTGGEVDPEKVAAVVERWQAFLLTSGFDCPEKPSD